MARPVPRPAPTAISALRRERGSEVLSRLREMAIACRLRPGERLSEVALAKELGVSRTPVREALTRLVTDGFLVPCPRGYMRRPLDVQEMRDLYEARLALECACARLAVERATDADIDETLRFLAATRAVPEGTPAERLVELDEAFHLRIAAMAGNAELRRLLANLNERIRYLRWIDMESVGRDAAQREHLRIARALRRRDAAACERHLAAHVAHRREQVAAAIGRALERLGETPA